MWFACCLLLAPPALCAPADAAPTVQSVDLRGVSVLRRQALRERLDLTDGVPLDEDAVEAARLRLLATGLFESVDARLERGKARGQVVLVFECVERGTASVDAIHLGHARPTLLWGGLEVSDLDPFALGLSIGGGFVTSEDQHAARLSVGRRGLFVPNLEVVLSARYLHGLEPFVGPAGQQLDGEDVSEIRLPYRRAGGDVGGRYRVGDLSLLLGVRGEWVTADRPERAVQIDGAGRARAFDFDAPDGATGQGVLSFGVEFDARDDPAHPSRGLRASIVGRAGVGAGGFAGGLVGFDQYLRLPFGHVLRLDAKAGAMAGDPPFFERFFIGDLHPYIPDRVLGLNFARRRGPNLVDGTIVEQRYETFAGRVGLEYRLPLARSSPDDPYGVELFCGAALLSLGSPGELGDTDFGDRDPFPLDVAIDFGLRIDSEIGVMGISVGNIFLLVDP